MPTPETLNYDNYEQPTPSPVSDFVSRIKGLVGGVLGGILIGGAAAFLTGGIASLIIPGISAMGLLPSGIALGGIIGGFEGGFNRR